MFPRPLPQSSNERRRKNAAVFNDRANDGCRENAAAVHDERRRHIR
jgi:hypothetical protein